MSDDNRRRVRPGEVKTTRSGKADKGGGFDEEPETAGGGAEDMGTGTADASGWGGLASARRLEAVLYSMGKTFDNLSSTRLATEEFLRTGNPGVLASRNDYSLLQDLKDASEFVLGYDYAHKPFDVSFLQQVSGHITRSGAMYPGVFRDYEGGVGTTLGHYSPQPVDPAQLEGFMREADQAGMSHEKAVRAASLLFLQLSKAQPFGDGNKRTAILTANGLLVKHRSPSFLTVPADDPEEVKEFVDLMSAYYVHDDPSCVDWLTGYNTKGQPVV